MTNSADAALSWGALLMFALCGCSFSKPEAQDPTPILGCYTADAAPNISIRADRLEINGIPNPVPYTYEFAKVGPIIRAPIDARIVKGQMTFEPAEDHFYRVLYGEGQPFLRVAFGPEDGIVDYRRSSASKCTSNSNGSKPDIER